MGWSERDLTVINNATAGRSKQRPYDQTKTNIAATPKNNKTPFS
jgi:hypothetical protein